MTVDEVKALVAKIALMASDDEAAHSMEDNLHSSVLAAIANGACDDAAACAREALKTIDIDFARWCA